jgi:hypothetical protein
VMLSEHARRRCQQRGVRPEDLEVALKAGPAHHHGDFVYRVTDRLLLRLGLAREAGRLRGLTVVVGWEGPVRTVKDGKVGLWTAAEGAAAQESEGRLMSRAGRRPPGSEPRDPQEHVG